MKKLRLDQTIVLRKLVLSRRQADSYIKLGQVTVDKKIVTETGKLVDDNDSIELKVNQQYVSRAGQKLASVSVLFDVNFHNKIVLDVGSSTGGFTDYALRHGAKKVVAVDIGTNQLHPSLLGNPKVKLHEKTDIRNFKMKRCFDVVLMDVSFISLREILPHVASLSSLKTDIVAMVKPQFETTNANLKNKGIIKNDRIRRDILKDFEAWLKGKFIIIEKADSDIAGTKGNLERFYLLKKL